MDRSVHQLRDELFRLLDRGESAAFPLWQEVWRLLVEHPWYQVELHQTAKRLVWRAQAPFDWAEDIEHEALLYLAKNLQHAPDLHVDRKLSEAHFSGWLATIIEHDCAQALRVRLSHCDSMTQLSEHPDLKSVASIELLIDLKMAISNLPPRIRTVVELYGHGWSLREIAADLDISYWQAYRTLRTALRHLRSVL